MSTSIRARVLLAIVAFEAVGYGTVAAYTGRGMEAALLDVREAQLADTFAANLARLDHTTDYMASVAHAMARAGAHFRNLNHAGAAVTPELQSWLIETLEDTPTAVGGGLWFEPGEFFANQERYGPYVARLDNRVIFTWDLNSRAYDYPRQAWYTLAIPPDAGPSFTPADEVVWTAPYRDEAGTRELMITVDAYIRDETRRAVGLATVDWSLAQMQAFVDEIRVTPGSRAFLVDGRGGLIVADPAHPERVMTRSADVAWMNALLPRLDDSASGAFLHAQIDGEDQLVTLARSKSGLIFGIHVPMREVGAASRQVALGATWITAGISALFILGGALILTRLFRPIGEVVRLIREATGQRDAHGERELKPIVYEARDELRGVVEAVNDLTAALRSRDERLAAYAAGLADAVAARTAELSGRNAELRRVLDTVDQAILTLDADGVIAPERSAITDVWLGPIAPGERLATVLSRHDPAAGAWFELGLEAVVAGLLPIEVTVDQLCTRAIVGGRHLSLRHRPILGEDGRLWRLLIVMTDITAVVAAEEKEQEQRERLSLFERVSRDRDGFAQLVSEGTTLVEAVVADELSPEAERRALHTLKGNLSFFGLTALAELVHGLEDQGADGRISGPARVTLGERWAQLRARVGRWVDAPGDEVRVEVDGATYVAFVQALKDGRGGPELVAWLLSWRLEPMERRLRHIGEYARTLSLQLGRPAPRLVLEPNGVRLDARTFGPFWQSFIHVVRNAVAHGLAPAEERLAHGRPAAGTLRLATTLAGSVVIIELADDGRGVDWAIVREKAIERGLPVDARSDLVAALFADGLSTQQGVTAVAGRGVGMAALQEAVLSFGGRIEVDDVPGGGTCFRFLLPVPYGMTMLAWAE